MSNMSYCRFENTSNDLGDCIEAQEEFDGPSAECLGAAEHSAYIRMLGQARRLLSQADAVDLEEAGVEW